MNLVSYIAARYISYLFSLFRQIIFDTRVLLYQRLDQHLVCLLKEEFETLNDKKNHTVPL